MAGPVLYHVGGALLVDAATRRAVVTAAPVTAGGTTGTGTPPDGTLILPGGDWPVLPDVSHLALPVA